ncbi:uncharacterized protein PEZ65_018558 [Lycodopsis pacificus]
MKRRKVLHVVLKADMELRREADIQQLLVVKEEIPPEQHEWSSNLDQEDPEPPHIKEDQEDPEPPHIKEEQEDPEHPHIKEEQEDSEPPHIKEDQEDPEPPHIKEEQEDSEPPHIKEDQEELRTSQEGEQLQGLEEADVNFSFTPVKSEDDEEEAHTEVQQQSSTWVQIMNPGVPQSETFLELHPETPVRPCVATTNSQTSPQRLALHPLVPARGESPAPLQQFGSRTSAVRGGELNYI